MRKLITVLFLLLFVAAAFVAWLMLPALSSPRSASLAQSAKLIEATRYVPDDVARVVMIHSVAATYRALSRNDVTAEAFSSYSTDDLHAASLLAGNSDALVWREGDSVHAVVVASPIRQALIRLGASFGGRSDVVTDGDFVVVGGATNRGRTFASELAALDQQTAGVLLLVERKAEGRGLLPISRPFVAGVEFNDEDLRVTARGVQSQDPAASNEMTFEAPKERSMMVALLTGDSEILRDLDRLLPLNVAPMAAQGMLVAIREIDTKSLLPRPRGVLAVADTPETRQALGSIFGSTTLPFGGTHSTRTVNGVAIDRMERLGAAVDIAHLGARLIIGLDSQSLDQYLSQPREPLALKAGEQWLLDTDPSALRPVADAVAKKAALRVLAPNVAKRAKQAEEWLGLFRGARRVIAVKKNGGREQLDMTISSEAK